jgi:transcription initiation factor TFIID subunit TAF12
MIDGIAGDAGKGAAAGAVVGTMRGGMKQRLANTTSKRQAVQSASAQMQQQYQQAEAAYNKRQDSLSGDFLPAWTREVIR